MTGTAKSSSSMTTEADGVLADRQASAAITASRLRQMMEDVLASYLNVLSGGSALSNFANDTAAATGGVPVNGFYRNGSQVMVRVS